MVLVIAVYRLGHPLTYVNRLSYDPHKKGDLHTQEEGEYQKPKLFCSTILPMHLFI